MVHSPKRASQVSWATSGGRRRRRSQACQRAGPANAGPGAAAAAIRRPESRRERAARVVTAALPGASANWLKQHRSGAAPLTAKRRLVSA